jgi:hypothetical protein
MPLTHIASFAGGTNFSAAHAETVNCGSGANRVAFVLMGVLNNTVQAPSSCLFGSDTLTARGPAVFTDATGRRWRLFSGPLTVTGTQTVTGTWTTADAFAVMCGVVLQVPNSADHIADLVSGFSLNTNGALTLTAAGAGDALLLGYTADGGLLTPGSGSSAFPAQDGVNGSPAPVFWNALTREIAGAGSISVGGTFAASNDWRGVAIRVPASAGGPTPATGMTVPLKLSDGSTAAASITGIHWKLLNAPTLGAATAVLAGGTAESTDASGNLVLDITGLGLSVGDVRYLVTGKSNGTPGANFDGWQGPVAAA